MAGTPGATKGRSAKEKAQAGAEAARRRPLVDHVVRVVQRYGEAKGNLQAGAMTYFGFLSFFPIMLMAFTVIGVLSRFYERSRADLVALIEGLFPEIIGGGEGEISLQQIEQAAAVTGPIALAGLLYAGLGWVTALRGALAMVFETTDRPDPNFVLAKLRDLFVLAVIGTTLLASVALSGVLSWGARRLLEWLTLSSELAPLLWLLSLVLGLAASTLFFFLIFKMLVRPPIPDRSLVKGAVVGALGFEVLKRVSGLLIQQTEGRPAFQAFGIALILLVWIHYFSRVVVFAACWAWTTREARALRDQQEQTQRSMEELTRVELREAPHVPVAAGAAPGLVGAGDRRRTGRAFVAGAAATLGVVAAARRVFGRD